MRSFWEADMQLHFVRGEKQHIFDDKGHKYLDTMNSVQHGRELYVYMYMEGY